MNDKAAVIGLGLASCVAFTFVMACAFGYGWGREDERREAIKADAARYEVDPRTGRVRFAYLPAALEERP